MKKCICILVALIPFLGNSQQNPNPTSPLLNGWQNVGNTHFSAGEAIYTSLDISPSGQPYVGYMDEGNSGKATVMKFDGTSWTNVGNAGFSAGVAQWISLVFNPIDGQPYVAFRDDAHSGKATVMKFDGANWVNVGIAGFSAGSSTWLSLAFSSSGQPFVAYTDYGNSLKATVMTFNGTNWVNVGNVGFTPADAECESLSFSPSGQLFIAYADGSTTPSLKASVMKFNGSDWVQVGSAGFSAGKTWSESLAFSPSGEPHVAYIGWADSSKVSVMKYNGTSWVYVGVQGFSKSGGYIHSEGLAFNPSNGQPYVAYEDTSSSYKASVMTFNGTGWVYVGNAGFSAGYTQTVSLAFNTSGQPYVAYGDGFMGQASAMKYDTTCNTLPIPTITGSGKLCMNSGYYNYSTEMGMNSYQWSISPGGTIISGQGTSVAQVIWNQAGNQWIAVNYTNSFGCTALNPTSFSVTVDPLPDSAAAINGSSIVCAGSNEIIYSVEPVVNAVTYVWTLPAGATITSGNGTNAIIVNFADNASSGNITVYGNNLCGNGTTSPSFYVTVNPIPETPTITVTGDTLFSSIPIGNQWFYNGILLVNDTNQIYIVSPYLPGYYWTQVTLNGCVSDTSNHIYYNITGFNYNVKTGLTLYPNPATTNVILEFPNINVVNKFIEIYTAEGKMIFETHSTQNRFNINVEDYPKGVYFVKLKTDESNFIEKFFKN
jgi:hypothetical protein